MSNLPDKRGEWDRRGEAEAYAGTMAAQMDELRAAVRNLATAILRALGLR